MRISCHPASHVATSHRKPNTDICCDNRRHGVEQNALTDSNRQADPLPQLMCSFTICQDRSTYGALWKIRTPSVDYPGPCQSTTHRKQWLHNDTNIKRHLRWIMPDYTLLSSRRMRHTWTFFLMILSAPSTWR
jgi:hypothetical protein